MAGRTKGLWMRLDLNFYNDPKVRALSKRHGENYVARWIKLLCLAYKEHGRLDLRDDMIRDWVEDEMGLKGKRLDDTISACVSVGLFDEGVWNEYRTVASGRMSDEVENVYGRSERARSAAKARWSAEKGDPDDEGDAQG